MSIMTAGGENVYFEINTVDLSAYVVEATAERYASGVDITTLNSVNKAQIPGKRSARMSVTLQADYANLKSMALLVAQWNSAYTAAAQNVSLIIETHPTIRYPTVGWTGYSFGGGFTLIEFAEIPAGTGDDLALIEASWEYGELDNLSLVNKLS